MSELNRIYDCIAPLSSPEELAGRIISGEQVAAKPKKRLRMRFVAAGAAAVAAASSIAAVSTASKENDIPLFYGADHTGGTEKILEYLMPPDNITVTENTFADCDVDFIGFAADGLTAYVGMEFTVPETKDGGEMLSMKALEENVSVRDLYIDGVRQENWACGKDFSFSGKNRMDILFRITTRGFVAGKCGVVVENYKDPSQSVSFEFDVEQPKYTVIDVKRSATIPVYNGKEVIMDIEGNVISGDGISDVTWYIDRISVSGITLMINFSREYVSGDPPAVGEWIYALLDDGTRIGVDGSTGSGRIEGNIETGQTQYEFKEPLDVSRLKAIVIGSEVFEV